MPTEPVAPPEAELLYRARSSKRLSVREAARRAGISENRWRQVEAGYQTIRKGVRVPANATASTLASMAHVLDISPDRLESDGQRPDAAEILRETLRRDESAHAAESELPRLGGIAYPDDYWFPPPISDDRLSMDRPYADAIYGRLIDLAANGIPNPTGAQLFPDHEMDAATWDNYADLFSVVERVWLIADLRRRQADRDRQTKAAG